jgi:hypothetical protein
MISYVRFVTKNTLFSSQLKITEWEIFRFGYYR